MFAEQVGRTWTCGLVSTCVHKSFQVWGVLEVGRKGDLVLPMWEYGVPYSSEFEYDIPGHYKDMLVKVQR